MHKCEKTKTQNRSWKQRNPLDVLQQYIKLFKKIAISAHLITATFLVLPLSPSQNHPSLGHSIKLSEQNY